MRPNWSRTLPRPLKIPGVMDLKTLADVRTLLGHLPKETRAKSTWRHVEAELKKAGADTAQVSIALQMVHHRAFNGLGCSYRWACRPWAYRRSIGLLFCPARFLLYARWPPCCFQLARQSATR